MKLGVFTLTLLMAACASPKQYTSFATAGSTYADAATMAVPEWLKLHIDYSSEQQLADQAAQPKLRPPSFSFRACQAGSPPRTCTDLGWVELAGRLQDHFAILKAYFVALNAVATSDAPDQASAAAGTLVQDLSNSGTKVDAALKSVGGNTAVPALTKLVISGAIRQTLRDRLSSDEQVLRQQFALEKAALNTMSNDATRIGKDLFTSRYQRAVIEPLANGQAVKSSDAWVARRQQELLTQLNPTSAALDDAVKALDNLTRGFESLVTGGDPQVYFDQVIADANTALSIVKALTGSTQ